MAVEVSVEQKDITKQDIFFEGNLVQSTTGLILLVTCVAEGYNPHSEGFWGIKLNRGAGQLKSEGGWDKSQFKQFIGTVTLEGKL